jgi:hypothetical protein
LDFKTASFSLSVAYPSGHLGVPQLNEFLGGPPMALTIRNIELWRKETENKPGSLAATLRPFAKGGADLQIVMAYRYPGQEQKAAIELFPVAGKKLTDAALAEGLSVSGIPTLLVEGDNRPGLGHAIAQSIADAGINLTFLVTQVIGRKYSAVMGFDSADEAKDAVALIKKASARTRR